MKKFYQKPYAKTILLVQESALLGGSNLRMNSEQEINDVDEALSNQRNSIWDND